MASVPGFRSEGSRNDMGPAEEISPKPSPLEECCRNTVFLKELKGKSQCMRCKEMIRERHLVLLNDGRFLHERCVCCEVCRRPFLQQDNKGKMFLRGDKPYCYKDYRQLYGSETKRKLPTCGKCSGQLEKGIWVRRAGEHLFHVTCFCCSKCDRQLSLNDRCVVREGRLICDKHFYEHDGSHKDESPKPRAKRMRTSFTDEQLRVLQHHFAIDSNPDGQDLERIAKATGLKKRVTQVWFQNNRARHKKTLQNKGGGPPGGAPPSLPTSFSPPLPPHHHGNGGCGGGGGGGMVYASASEEGDSCQGADLGVYCSDPERPDENSGGGGGGGGAGGGGMHAEFAAAQQSFWPHLDN